MIPDNSEIEVVDSNLAQKALNKAERERIARSSKIVIMFDPETHKTTVEFDKEFKTFEFILAIMETGKRAIENTARMAQVQQMQQAAIAEAQEHAVRQQIMRGK